ncbi:MAG: SRPBCC family protein [Solirubrobacterales bacterium]
MAPSDEAVKQATGQDWSQWFAYLREKGAMEMDHKAIVQLLSTDGGVDSGWWQQGITVEFEKSIGRRELGRTSDGGFQVGVRQTFPVDPETASKLMTSPDAAAIWLGVDQLPAEVGDTVTDADGHRYELRSKREGERVRLRRTDAETGDTSTVQIALEENKTGTSVTFHHEGLADAGERAHKKEHWRTIADKLLGIV